MLMTGKPFIQEVLFFPQMRPEKVAPKDAPAKYTELGIPADWVPVIQKAGYNLVHRAGHPGRLGARHPEGRV